MLFEHGQYISNKLFTFKFHIVIQQNNEKPVIQAGFLVRRSFGNAVKRNRMKRLIREAYRHEQHILDSLHQINGLTLIMGFLVKQKVVVSGLSEVQLSVNEILNQLMAGYEGYTRSSH